MKSRLEKILNWLIIIICYILDWFIYFLYYNKLWMDNQEYQKIYNIQKALEYWFSDYHIASNDHMHEVYHRQNGCTFLSLIYNTFSYICK